MRRRRGGGSDRHHSRANRCRAWFGGGNQPGCPGTDPAGAERRERSQRRVRDAVCTLFIAVVAAEEGIGDTAWGLEALKQIGLAIVAALIVGYVGGNATGIRQGPPMDQRCIRADRHPCPCPACVRRGSRDWTGTGSWRRSWEAFCSVPRPGAGSRRRCGLRRRSAVGVVRGVVDLRSWRPPRGRFCSRWCWMASRRRRWRLGTGRGSRARARYRRRRLRASPDPDSRHGG